MSRAVEIRFDCLPLRSVGRVDIPLDASPEFQALCQRIAAAMDEHGTHNTYYLYEASAIFHLTNASDRGMLEFSFEGTLFTDATDRQAERAQLAVALQRETCDWITEPVVAWFGQTVREAVVAEFDRYIAAGSLNSTLQRAARLQQVTEASGGFLGMYL